MRTTFASAALASLALVRAEYETISAMRNGGQSFELFYQPLSWENGQDVDNLGNGIAVGMNSNVFIHDYPYDGQYWAYKPALRGGSIEYDVDLSDFDCGCVAGLYMVKMDDESCSEGAKTGTPQCPHIDIMQANPFGFNASAHPCANGQCDGQSQCFYNMAVEGMEKYGSGQYGPGGAIIDTDKPFHVWTEFLSKNQYQELWGLRTHLSQEGRALQMEADCGEYMSGLAQHIEGNMGFVATAWDNRYDGTAQNAEFSQCQSCQEDAPTCEGMVNRITNIQFWEYGSNEEQKDDEEENDDDEEDQEDDEDEEEEEDEEDEEEDEVNPEPVDLMKPLLAYSDQEGYEPMWEMYVEGIYGSYLDTIDFDMWMGPNNRVWVMDYPYSDDTYYAYMHNLIGGSVEFDVDVSDVDCACAAGVFAVDLNNEECSWNAKPEDVTPQCSSVDIMEANIWGFNVQSDPCEFGECTPQTQCSNSMEEGQYGPSSEYIINSNEKYHVRTCFMASVDEAGEPLDLEKVVTTLTQGDAKVELVQDCPDYLAALSWKLYYQMNIGISTYALDLENDVSGQCTSECEGGNLHIANLQFNQLDSLLIDDDEESNDDDEETDLGELIWDVSATTLEDGECGTDCAECRWSYYEFDPENWAERCYERHENNIKFGGKCWRALDLDACTDEGPCHKSWYITDADKWQSEDAKCRTVPNSYIENDFKYGNRECRRPDKAGLCRYGCEEGETCHNSWFVDDEDKWKGASAMCRCKPVGF